MKIKTRIIQETYMFLSQAKITSLSVNDKIKVLKIVRALKPVAVEFEEYANKAAESMKTSDDLFERYQKAQQYEMMSKNPKCDISQLPFGPAENAAFWKEWAKYNQDVDKALKEPGDAEKEVDFEQLSEEAFGLLIDSNNWTIGQIEALSELIMKPIKED